MLDDRMNVQLEDAAWLLEGESTDAASLEENPAEGEEGSEPAAQLQLLQIGRQAPFLSVSTEKGGVHHFHLRRRVPAAHRM